MGCETGPGLEFLKTNRYWHYSGNITFSLSLSRSVSDSFSVVCCRARGTSLQNSMKVYLLCRSTEQVCLFMLPQMVFFGETQMISDRAKSLPASECLVGNTLAAPAIGIICSWLLFDVIQGSGPCLCSALDVLPRINRYSAPF